MKFAIVAVLAVMALCAHGLSTEEQKTKFREQYEACMNSSQADKELLAKARKGEYTGRDEKLKNYFHCMTTKMAFQRDDGTFDLDKMAEQLPATINRETGMKGLKKCSESEKTTAAPDKAMDFVYCFYKTMGKDVTLY